MVSHPRDNHEDRCIGKIGSGKTKFYGQFLTNSVNWTGDFYSCHRSKLPKAAHARGFGSIPPGKF